MQNKQKYQVLDTYHLDIPPSVEELEALELDLRERHGSIMETGSITICITSDTIIYAYDPDWIFAQAFMGELPWRSAFDKVSKRLYRSLEKLSCGFFLPVVLRRHGDHILDVNVMLRCLTVLPKIA